MFEFCVYLCISGGNTSILCVHIRECVHACVHACVHSFNYLLDYILLTKSPLEVIPASTQLYSKCHVHNTIQISMGGNEISI